MSSKTCKATKKNLMFLPFGPHFGSDIVLSSFKAVYIAIDRIFHLYVLRNFYQQANTSF